MTASINKIIRQRQKLLLLGLLVAFLIVLALAS